MDQRDERMPAYLQSLGAALVLAVWGGLCVWVALIPDSGMFAFGLSLGAMYATAAVGLSVGAFWARWFARGLGWWGAIAGVMLSLMTGFGELLVVFAGSHAAVVFLLGEHVAWRYDAKDAWREGLDEKTQHRIASLFANLGSILPYIAFYAFFPRGAVGGAFWALSIGAPDCCPAAVSDDALPLEVCWGWGGAVAATAFVLAALGFVGLARLRTWGLLALAVVAFGLLATGLATLPGPGAWLAIALGSTVSVRLAPFAPAVSGWLREPPKQP